MEIRRARPGDGPGIGLVHVRSWQTTYKGIVPQEFLDRMDVEKRCAWWTQHLLQSVQGQGLGRVLMERIVSDLWAAGHRNMVLGALSENPACRFYEHMGGKLLQEVQVTRGGKELGERFYGWTDLNPLLP